MRTSLRYFKYMLGIVIYAFLLIDCSNDKSSVTGAPPSDNKLTVSITSPADSQAFVQNESIFFSGAAVYGANSQVSDENLVWRSDKDGIIGLGNSFIRSGLSVNTHTITLTAAGPSGEQESASIQMAAQNNANGVTALINSPAAGTQIKSHELIRLEGAGFAPGGNPVTEPLSFEWKSNFDNVLGNGRQIEPGGLLPGLHQITLSATVPDSSGSSFVENTAVIELFVEFDNDPAINAAILAPASGQQHPAGQPIAFNGAASEPNGDPIPLNNITWISAMDGEVGRGESCVVPGLSPGIHRITMTVTGQSGKKNTATIIVNAVQ